MSRIDEGQNHHIRELIKRFAPAANLGACIVGCDGESRDDAWPLV